MSTRSENDGDHFSLKGKQNATGNCDPNPVSRNRFRKENKYSNESNFHRVSIKFPKSLQNNPSKNWKNNNDNNAEVFEPSFSRSRGLWIGFGTCSCVSLFVLGPSAPAIVIDDNRTEPLLRQWAISLPCCRWCCCRRTTTVTVRTFRFLLAFSCAPSFLFQHFLTHCVRRGHCPRNSNWNVLCRRRADQSMSVSKLTQILNSPPSNKKVN